MDHCAAYLRREDRDRYLAALVAPASARGHLAALYALDMELARIRERISEPLAGELRLRWWRDAITALYHGAPAGHPVVDALGSAIEAGDLPLTAFQATVDARIAEQYADPPPDMAELEGYFGETCGLVVQLACLVLAGGRDEGSGTAAGHAGMALGLVRLLRNLPRHAAGGKVFLPQALMQAHGFAADEVTAGRACAGLDAALAELRALAWRHLEDARREVARLPRRLRPAFAPLGTVAPYLRASAQTGDPLKTPLAVSPLRRQWGIWRAARGAF